WARGVAVLDVLLVPMIVFWAIGYEQYLLSAVFGVVLTGLSDPGGGFGDRAVRLSVFGLLGAGLTALAFGIGGEAWGWLVLATFLVTVVCGLAVTFGVRRFVTAMLLNVWFIVALGVAVSLHHHSRITDYTWAQVASWAAGSALWIVVEFLWWLVGGRHDSSQPLMELPGDTSRRPLTAAVIAFAVIRALALAGAVALAFGLDLSHGYWLPIATLVAMKPSLEQATVTALQRLAGAVIGAVVAGLLLLIPAAETGRKLFAVTHGLEVVALVLLMHGVAVRTCNYALYTAVIAAAALILVDLPQPSDYGAEGDRVLWTLCGVAIGVFTMVLAGLLAKRHGKAPAPGA
ncbi:FUSC family protein, partial [Actinacidiphila rubida]